VTDEEFESTSRRLIRPGYFNIDSHALKQKVQLQRTRRRRVRVAESNDHLSIFGVSIMVDTSDAAGWPASLPKRSKQLARIRTGFLIVLRRGHKSRNGRRLPHVGQELSSLRRAQVPSPHPMEEDQQKDRRGCAHNAEADRQNWAVDESSQD